MGVNKCKQKLAWIFLGKRLSLSEKHSLKCPRCGAKLNKINKQVKESSNKESVVILDICPNCQGMWLDDGEIDKLNNLLMTKKKVKKKSKK